LGSKGGLCSKSVVVLGKSKEKLEGRGKEKRGLLQYSSSRSKGKLNL
jgi:hypothetical protein